MNDDPGNTAAVETRRLAAIMFTDIAGFSRQMGSNEARTLRLLEVHNQLIRQTVAAHHGTVIKTVGDAFLVDFPSVVHAVQCAQQIQTRFKAQNAEKEKAEQIHVRIGIHLGDIVQKEGDVFGDGVNIASRLQALAEPDTICISDVVYRDVAKKLDLGTVVSLGRPKLKNIAERFPVYLLVAESPQGVRQTLHVQRLKVARWVRPLGFVLVSVLLLAGIALFLYPSRLPPRTSNSELRTDAAGAALPLPDKPSIVVLPFTNMSDDPKQDYFSDGITEDITTDLSKLASLFVISRNSAFTYKGKAVKVQQVSQELGVRYVLEGSVRKANDQVRITAQLIDAVQGQHLWGERYDRPLQEIFAVQDDIRQQIVFALKVKLTPEEQARFKNAPTNNLEAYDLYLRGGEALRRALTETRKEANEQAQQLYMQAIEADPQYAGAHAMLGLSHLQAWLLQWSHDRVQSLERAFAFAQRAVALDDSLALSHWALGGVHMWQKQHDQALVEVERAIALNPNGADGYWILGQILIASGRAEEAIGVLEHAMRLNPRYPLTYLHSLGWAYRRAGRYEEAISIQKKVLTLNPNFLFAHMSLAICYVELGRLGEAHVEAAEILRISPKFSLEEWRQTSLQKDQAALERELTVLRKAGLK